MPKLPLRLSGILAQFPDTHFPSVRHSHAQAQEEGHYRPCPTIQMQAAHRVRWSSLSNKASFVIPRLRSCDFSLLPLSFPHTLFLLSLRLLRRPELNSRDRFRRFRRASNAFFVFNRSSHHVTISPYPLLALHTFGVCVARLNPTDMFLS
jgi:hypothetical protein